MGPQTDAGTPAGSSVSLASTLAEPPSTGASDVESANTVQACGVGRRTLCPCRPIVRRELTDEIDELTRSLRGLCVIDVNATPAGGGVAELVQSVVPLLRDVGIDAEWYVMPSIEDFFAVTKRLHDLLQGVSGALTEADQRIYRAHNERTLESLQHLRPDIWVIHEVNTGGLRSLGDGGHVEGGARGRRRLRRPAAAGGPWSHRLLSAEH